jgi:hypothetical protein
MDVALARTGRTRDLSARTYLGLDPLPEHRQTQEIRSKLFDHVCALVLIAEVAQYWIGKTEQALRSIVDYAKRGLSQRKQKPISF